MMAQKHDMTQTAQFLPILRTHNQADIAIIKSILGQSKISFYFQGESFLNMHSMIEPAVLMVDASSVEEARQMLSGLDIQFYSLSTSEPESMNTKISGAKLLIFSIVIITAFSVLISLIFSVLKK